MSILHTVNKSPFEKSDLASCLSHANDGDAVLLIEDGVYGAIDGTASSSQIDKSGLEVFVLEADLEARGIAKDKVASGVKFTGYDGFVDLVAKHDAVNSWL